MPRPGPRCRVGPVATEVWADVHEVPHVRIGQWGRPGRGRSGHGQHLGPAAAHGIADDLLTSTLLTARCPVVFAPAMHTEMWEHPATRANVATLRERGALVIEPAAGRLTGADSGKGRLPDPAEIFGLVTDLMARSDSGDPLVSRPDRSPCAGLGRWHPGVPRPGAFLGNRSSGLQGFALARTAEARGAEVILVAANTTLDDPAGVTVVEVETTEQMQSRGPRRVQRRSTAVVMAAAPADFRPVDQADAKIKKSLDASTPTIDLVETPDILAGLVRARPSGSGPGDRRLRGGDRRRRRGRARPRARQAGAQGL